MPFPMLPEPAPGEIFVVCVCYTRRGLPKWGPLLEEIGGARDGDVVVLGSGVRLRLIVDPRFERWTPESINYLRGGDVPALIPPGKVRPPVAVLDDVAADSGYAEPLLVDLVGIPGRGIRALGGKFDEVLHALLTGEVVFDDLIRDMDSGGVYQGYGGVPAVSALTTSNRRAYPPLPVCETTLLVRTCFDDPTDGIVSHAAVYLNPKSQSQFLAKLP